jgi:hypothetical protein
MTVYAVGKAALNFELRLLISLTAVVTSPWFPINSHFHLHIKTVVHLPPTIFFHSKATPPSISSVSTLNGDMSLNREPKDLDCLFAVCVTTQASMQVDIH